MDKLDNIKLDVLRIKLIEEKPCGGRGRNPSLDPRLDPDLGIVLGLSLVLDLEAVLLPEIEDRVC